MGAWMVDRFKSGVLGEKEGVFLRGVDTPPHTMSKYWYNESKRKQGS